MANVAGIDIGLTYITPSSGICCSGDAGFRLGHTYADRLSRETLLSPVERFDVIAIDGPVLPSGVLSYAVRPCEKVFVWRKFGTRCKPGESQVSGTGQALRRAGCDTAVQFSGRVSNRTGTTFPQVQNHRSIIEAFPNGFLGLLLPDHVFSLMPALGRGKKFDWLFDRALQCEAFDKLREVIAWPDDDLWWHFQTNQQHDERAALICVLTAIGADSGSYTAVGEPSGGYLFLPPWALWQDWAKLNLDRNRRDRRLPRPVHVWIDGRLFGPDAELP